MKYICTFLILIVLSSSVFALGQNTRWIILNSLVLNMKPPLIFQQASSGQNGYVMYSQKETFETEYDCYTALKDVALANNKKIKDDGLATNKYKIDIIDDVEISASKSNAFGIDSFHCIEITLSR